MTHTPPPWRIHTFTPKGWSTETTTILGPDDVAIVGGVHWGSADGSVGQANARLIAASPRMFEYIVKRASDGDVEAAEIVAAIHAPC